MFDNIIKENKISIIICDDDSCILLINLLNALKEETRNKII